MHDQLTLHTVDAVEVQLDIAGAGSRAYAFLIDWHIRALAAAVLFVPLTALLGWLQERTDAVGVGTLVLAWLVPLAVYLFYHPVLEIAMRGRTPGKRWAGLRIVAADGSTPGVGPLLVRNLFRIVDSLPALYTLGLVVMLLTRNQVRIGDLAAGTLVVHDGAGRGGLDEAARVPQRLSPQAHQLLAEWLARWPELEARGRDAIAQRVLVRVPDPAGAALGGRALRDHVRALLADAR